MKENLVEKQHANLVNSDNVHISTPLYCVCVYLLLGTPPLAEVDRASSVGRPFFRGLFLSYGLFR